MKKTIFNSTITMGFKSAVAMLLIFAMSIPFVAKAEEEYWTPMEGLCPEGFVYDDDQDLCVFPDELGITEMRFKTPIHRTVTITLKFRNDSIAYSGADYDFFECSTVGDGTICKTNAIGVMGIFGYKMYYVVPK